MGKGKVIRFVLFSSLMALFLLSGCSPMSKSKKRNSSQVCLDYFNFVESSKIKDDNVKKREKTMKKINKERAKARK